MTERPEEDGFAFWDRSIDSEEVDDVGSIDNLGLFSTTRRLRRGLPAEPPEPRPEPPAFSVFDREDFDAEQTGPFPLPKGETLPPPPSKVAPATERVTASTPFGELNVAPVLNTETPKPRVVSQRGPSRIRTVPRRPKESVLARWFGTFDQPPPLAIAAMAGSFAVVLAVIGFWAFTKPGDEVTVAGPVDVGVDGSPEAEPPLAPELVEDTDQDPTEPSPEAAPIVEDSVPESTTAPQSRQKTQGESEQTRRAREKASESTTTTSKPQPSSTAARVVDPPEPTTTTVPEETTTTTVEPTTTTAPTTTTDPSADEQNEDGEIAID